MKKKYILSIVILLTALMSCKNYLDVNPKGVLSQEQAEDPAQVEKFVIAAYSHMAGLGYGDTHNPWIQSVRSDDAYKGGGGLNDQTPWYEMELFTLVTPNTGNNDGPWFSGYRGISRANTALRILATVTPEAFPKKEERIAEMKFIRSWIYLGMKLRWNYVPWISETTPNIADSVARVPNRVPNQNDLPLWDRIIKDFEDAAAALPETQAQKGRPTKYAAHAFAAKALLFRAYEKNDQHQVTTINLETLNKALAHIDAITAKDGSTYDLEPDFGNNFLVEYDNTTKESLWEIQYSIDDGTTDGRINRGDELNAPYWAPFFSCCDFHKPSQTLINAFKTDDTGIPDFVNYNNTEFGGDAYKAYFTSHSFDPRLSHTVAIPGYPFKYQNSLLYEERATRDVAQYGFFKSMKEQVPPDCNCLFKPFFVYNSMNKKEIRYAEVLLWKAEILVQLGREMEALPIINRIRARAANSTQRLKKNDGTNWMNYRADAYQPGVNCTWTKDFAMQAVMWENRLELACEGRRFFDLMRWGQLEPTMNAYIAKEGNRFAWFKQGRFVAGRDEFLPVPQPQMNYSQGSYTQNPGY